MGLGNHNKLLALLHTGLYYFVDRRTNLNAENSRAYN